MGIVKSTDKTGMWEHHKTGFIIWDLLNVKDIHTQERKRLYLGRMWELPDGKWAWESAWGMNQGVRHNDLDALMMIKIVAHEHYGTTHKLEEHDKVTMT